MDEISVSVIIPKRILIYPSLCLFYKKWFRPFAGRVLCFGHVNAKVGIAVVDEEFTAVKTYRRRPHAAAMLRSCESVFWFLLAENVIDDTPIYEVFRMQYRQPGHGIKTRRRHIKIRADANSVGVGIVGVYDRI